MSLSFSRDQRALPPTELGNIGLLYGMEDEYTALGEGAGFVNSMFARHKRNRRKAIIGGVGVGLAIIIIVILITTTMRGHHGKSGDGGNGGGTEDATISVNVKFDSSMPASKGRLLVYFTKVKGDDDASVQPRSQGSDGASTAQIFGVDVADSTDGSFTIGTDVMGYPLMSLADIPPGDYLVQAQLYQFKTYYTGKDRQALNLRESCVANGEDGTYGPPPGTLFSKPQKETISSLRGLSKQVIEILIDQEDGVEEAASKEIPGCAGLGMENSEYIRTLRVNSTLLGEFWGQDVILEACILLPYGFDDHPEAKYPLMIGHGHYSAIFAPGGGFRPEPPEAGLSGYKRVSEEYDHYLYTNWTSPDGVFENARMLVITINHANPFFDDSYAVDSENVGPYGSAIHEELIPAIEEKYRGIGAGWARATFGGSTGGWESVAAQVLYPDFYNSCFAACPDPITFTSYTTVNIYKDKNAYYYDSDFKTTERPGMRDQYSGQLLDSDGNPTYVMPYGHTAATIKEMNYHELVMGQKSSSCGQWDIWEAVFGPRGSDGYPARIWNKVTGEINETVAAYWKENFDLVEIMRRDWESGLGEKLKGKLHIFAGADDTFFLSNPVMDAQDFLLSTTNPYFDGEVTIGEHDGRGFAHCFNGYSYDVNGKKLPNAITREMYLQKFVPLAAEHFFKTAPSSIDKDDPVLMGWRY